MKHVTFLTCLLTFATLTSSYGYGDTNAGYTSGPISARSAEITNRVTARLAAENLDKDTKINVVTDNNGVVWLTGNAVSDSEAARIVAAARATEGVVTVSSEIVVKRR